MNLENLKRIALVGATTNKEKYGYIILKDLTGKGFDVIPITPKYEEIEGIKTVKSVGELDKNIDLIVFVVPPKVGLSVTKEAIENGFRTLWYQPGAYSSEIDTFLKEKRIDAVHDKCIMVETRR
ncbi:CoA-binding protein [Thermosipho melanesiensis]|uniref:CoA-binding domain protein n=2 Tax=Thermosipho melanesiensis TaxID=46541 RepID=A6LL20_THEM4|nr:CoA-binding protein [Thermosipho melanesiensis]ABR30621.1 CoA-binding domain protein [Thermosipho melanesiensis BI429]APT73761.1 CoA-binding protein [Thermosipho melanesiensis]OOC35701.1 CoA-binding protein [Thermosipho melanesiensis]OOC39000.1 CoA-binding protein [Thermosipho melanesiensis]OOC39148.1 CoA-binding protein [Thermosipho melanesiensis]